MPETVDNKDIVREALYQQLELLVKCSKSLSSLNNVGVSAECLPALTESMIEIAEYLLKL